MALRGLLRVPEDRRVPELERLRTSPVKASGRVLVRELDRVAEIGGLGAGRVETEPVPAVTLASLAQYGIASKAPMLRDLEERRQTATLLATVRHLQTASIDDTLDLLDLLARAERAGKAAFTLCAVMHLHTALRRRDVFAAGADRWSDPRARLLEGAGWEAARPGVLAALELGEEPAGHLAELASALEGAYTRVLDGLGGNTSVQFVGGRLQVEKLGPLAEPPLMGEFRALIDGMLPRVNFPELLLEVFDRTRLAADFTHISGADTAMEDFAVSLCGLLVAEVCNVGLIPVEKPNVPALTRARLQQVDQGYLCAETISAANAQLIAAQAGIDIVNCWGGGQIASADGLRFVVPVANLHIGAEHVAGQAFPGVGGGVGRRGSRRRRSGGVELGGLGGGVAEVEADRFDGDAGVDESGPPAVVVCRGRGSYWPVLTLRTDRLIARLGAAERAGDEGGDGLLEGGGEVHAEGGEGGVFRVGLEHGG
ncbi:Tn3 transposase DDE domain-containing protein [Thermomonospora echinospora]|uniref:Tn3 transposase DDE domain-containing protein n=1 Tax=Thermomonospora echinospora TaxID=1992 RepID=A0A1H6D8P8_9ACTN|nr:Tn3 transposase DDE domain-containing protein [Thermomonospora echinospora]